MSKPTDQDQPLTDSELLQLYADSGRNATALAAKLGINERESRRRVAAAKLRLGDEPMILEQLDPSVQNVIEHELLLGSVPHEGSRIAEAWIKGKHVSVHLVPRKAVEAIPARPHRIAIIDIETAPNLGYTWGKYEQNVIAFEREWFMLSFAYKWAGESKVYAAGLPDFPGYDNDRYNDAPLVAELWRVLDEADIVVAHNGDKFDVKKANARFLLNEMTPPSPFRTVDTLKIARRNFALTSNKLGDIAEALGVGSKQETGGFDLWRACMDGDRAAWKKMIKYNVGDVVVLEGVWEKLRPWHAHHPTGNDDNVCASCGSDHLIRRGIGIRSGKTYRRLQCFDCGKWSREKGT